MKFAVPANDWVKLEENEKGDKYVELASDLKNNYEAWKWWY